MSSGHWFSTDRSGTERLEWREKKEHVTENSRTEKAIQGTGIRLLFDCYRYRSYRALFLHRTPSGIAGGCKKQACYKGGIDKDSCHD